MKKYLLLILAVFLLTGCNCKYDITIDDTTIKENITIISDSNEEINGSFKSEIDNLKNNEVACYIQEYHDGNYKPNTELYSFELINNNEKYGLKSTFKYPSGSYEYSTALNILLGNHVKIDTSNGYHVIIDDLSPIFNEYSSLNDLTVTIISNKKITGNYSLKSNNRYIWGFNRISYKDSIIDFVIEDMKKLSVRDDIISTTHSTNGTTTITGNEKNNIDSNEISNSKGLTKEQKKVGSIFVKFLLIAFGLIIFIFLIITVIKIKNANN